MRKILTLLIGVFLSTIATAQATREDIQEAYQRATMASLFSIKAEICKWDHGDIAWKDLYIHSVAIAISSSDAGKRLNQQQTTAIAEKVTSTESIKYQTSLVEAAVSKGVCEDEKSPTNKDLWRQTVGLVKAIIQKPVEK